MEDVSKENSQLISWEGIYRQKIKEILSNEDVKLQDITNCIYEYGILGHISPTNWEKEKRLNEGKEVFDRSDPELYERIVYSCLYINQSLAKNASVVSGFAAQVTAIAVIESATLHPELFSGGQINPYNVVVSQLVEKAKEDYKKSTGLEMDVLSLGNRFNLNDLNLEIEGYTHDGKLLLKPVNDLEMEYSALSKRCYEVSGKYDRIFSSLEIKKIKASL